MNMNWLLLVLVLVGCLLMVVGIVVQGIGLWMLTPKGDAWRLRKLAEIRARRIARMRREG